MKRIRKGLAWIWKVFVGAALCQFPLTSIVAIGWTYRAMQRRALRIWQSHSPLTHSDRHAMVRNDRLFMAHETWPNWFMQQKELRRAASAPAGIGERLRRWMGAAFGSLWQNLRTGLLGIFNTSVLMALPAVLWQVGWYAGWDNSFNKGYEQYFVGIALSWTGIVMFLAIMLYLPMAQARQAVTGQWRAFYDVRTVWAITRNAPIRAVLLAGIYSLVSLPISITLSVPLLFENLAPSTATMSDSELIQFLNRYYFRLAIYGFIAYVFVRWVAAGWYARTIVELLHAGRLKKEALGGAERYALRALQLDHEGDAARLHPAIAATLALSRPVWRGAVLGGAVLVWFTFVAQMYVREFLVYHPVRGFLNQPLVQLPWFRYVPEQLTKSARADAKMTENSPKTAKSIP